jgi:exosome complex RNA-binding protein Csl4
VRRCLKVHEVAEPGYTVNSNKPNGHIASQTEIFRLEDFVRARVVKDGLGMDTCLVRESAVAAAEALSFGSK